jgi:hypothetical protein
METPCFTASIQSFAKSATLQELKSGQLTNYTDRMRSKGLFSFKDSPKGLFSFKKKLHQYLVSYNINSTFNAQGRCCEGKVCPRATEEKKIRP